MKEEVEPNSISKLLYYDPSKRKHGELGKGLEEYKFILQISRIALEHFRQGDYEKFDGLVGENACQIRAVKVTLLGKYGLTELERCLEQIDQKLQTVDALQKPQILHMHSYKQILRQLNGIRHQISSKI